MHRLTAIIIFCYLTGMTGLKADAQQTHEQFLQPTNYLLYLPEGYTKDSTVKWPLMIFLHGSGEHGNDLEKVKTHGPPKLIEAGKKFPFIVVSPQAPHQVNGWDIDDLYYLLQDIKQRYRVDADRVYLTGLSMGGFGSWKLAIKYPEEFAAVVPICGGGDTAEIWKLRHTAVWCFHGAKDNNVPLERDQQMIGALRAYNPSAKLTVYPEAGHDSWTVTYNNDSLYTWLLAQKKYHYTQQPAIALSILQKYAGTYIGMEKDTVIIQVKDNALQAFHRGMTIPLLPDSDTTFFIKEHEPVDIRFMSNARGKVTGMTVFENQRTDYKKVL